MTSLNSKINEDEKKNLLGLLYLALGEARRVHTQYGTGNDKELAYLALVTTEMLTNWIDAVSAGDLQIARHRGTGQGVRMGLWRGISDWCEDEALLDAIDKLESYFLEIQE